MVHHIPRMLEYGAGVEKRVEVKNVIVGGRRPHVFLLFVDKKRQPRGSSRGADYLA